MCIFNLFQILNLLVFVQIKAERKVFEGEEVTSTKEIPFICNLQIKTSESIKGRYKTSNCGGSYIRKNWILTASHCIKHMFPLANHKPSMEIKICMGITSDNVQKCPKESLRIADEAYPFSEANYKKHDICVLHIEKPFELGPTIQIANLPTKKVDLKVYNNKRCLVAGWGLTSPTHKAKVLKKATVKAIVGNKKLCATENNKQICVRSVSGITCQGDSGGPLVCENIVIGVLRGGIGACDNLDKVSMFNAIQEYQDWITRITGYMMASGSNSIVPNTLGLCIFSIIVLKF